MSKIYVPGSSAKAHRFQDGNHILKLGFHVEALEEFIKAHTNDRGYLNLVVSKRREPGKHGETHSVYLDDWQPRREGSTGSTRPATPTADSPEPVEQQDDVPF